MKTIRLDALEQMMIAGLIRIRLNELEAELTTGKRLDENGTEIAIDDERREAVEAFIRRFRSILRQVV